MNKTIAIFFLTICTGVAIGIIGAALPDAAAASFKQQESQTKYLGGGCWKHRHAVYCE